MALVMALPGALNEKLGPFAIDGVPPAPVDLQRACDDDAVDDGENVADIVRVDAAADKRRKRSGRPDLAEIVEIGGVTGALAGEDDDIGVEKLDVANELGDWPVLHDGVGAMLDMRVGENLYVPRLKQAAVTHRFRGRAFDQALVGDIGVGPLIDPHEARACRACNRESVKGGVGQHVDPNRQPGCDPDAICRDRHMRRGFRADVLRFREGNVAVVLDNEAVKAGVGVSSRIAKRPRIDRLDPAARIVWRSRQRQEVNDADQYGV